MVVPLGRIKTIKVSLIHDSSGCGFTDSAYIRGTSSAPRLTSVDFVRMQYPPLDPLAYPPSALPPQTASITNMHSAPAPTTPSGPPPSQHHLPNATPTPTPVMSPHQTEKAIFAPLVQKVKKSLLPMTYNEDLDDLEVYNYPFRDEALTDPYHPQDLPYLWRAGLCPPIHCFCPAAGATYAQSFAARVFKCSNGNPQWNGVWLAACAQRRCGLWFPFGIDGVASNEMDFFVRVGGQLPGQYCPPPSSALPSVHHTQVTSPPQRLPSLTTFAMSGLEGFACPNYGGGTLVGLGPTSNNSHGPSSSHVRLASLSPSKSSQASKGKSKAKSVNASMNLATMLSQIPNLSEIVANALGDQGFQIASSPEVSQAQFTAKTSSFVVERSPTPEYVRLPAGPNIGPLGLPVRTPTRRGSSQPGPYSRSNPSPALIARESAVASELGKKLNGVFRAFESEPSLERVGHAMTFYFQMNDEDFPGVTPRQFTDTFWQCPHCDRILTIWKIKLISPTV